MATTRVKWIEGNSFLGVSQQGRSIVMSGADGPGVSPMQLLLLALGGCAAIDVVDILRKQRQPLAGLEVQVSGERASELPKPWETAQILRSSAKWPKPVHTKLLETHTAADVRPLVQLLAEQPSEASIALVGHQPVLGLLVSELCGDATARIAMRKGAIAWLEGEPGRMALSGLLVPGMMRRAD